MNSPNHHRVLAHQRPLKRAQYESKKDQPCPSICELDHAVFCCDLLENHKSDVHRADLIDKRGSTVIVTWKDKK